MLMVLFEQELVGHSGDVIAYGDVPGFCARRFLMRGGHGARRIEIITKELFETADGTVAVFGDGWVVVNVLEEKAFQLGVALGKSVAETGKPAGGTPNVVYGCSSGSEYATLCGLDEIGGQVIEHEPERCIEFELLASGRVCGVDLGISFGKNRNFFSQGIEIEELCFARVIEIRGVVCDFIDPIDELAFERRAKIEKIFGKMREFRGGVVMRVLDNSFANFEGEIQAGKIEIGTLELLDDAERLKIVIKTRAAGAH